MDDVNDDQGGRVRLLWRRSYLDRIEWPTAVTGYTIYRRQDAKSAQLRATFDQDGRLIEDAKSMEGWDVVATVSAHGDSIYQYVAETLCDSTEAGGICWSVFALRAFTDYGEFFDAEVDSGYSVDNIAPGVPTSFSTAYLADGVTLDWDDPPETDFQFHRIYRGTDPGFIPSPDNLVHETSTSIWTDQTANPWGYHYQVTAMDHAGNESEAGSPTEVTGAEGGVVPARTALLDAVPNPFNPSTKLSFEMATAGNVRLKVYDYAGRLVATLVNEHRDVGSHSVIWDGRDNTGRKSSAGVYLYRMEVGIFTETKRMVLVK